MWFQEREKMIVIISCGKQKQKTEDLLPLSELYTGYQTKLKIRLAKLISEQVHVISGRWGVVPLDFRSPHYDSGNRLPGAAMVQEQIRGFGGPIIYIGQKKGYRFLKRLGLDVRLLFKCSGNQDFQLKCIEFILILAKMDYMTRMKYIVQLVGFNES